MARLAKDDKKTVTVSRRSVQQESKTEQHITVLFGFFFWCATVGDIRTIFVKTNDRTIHIPHLHNKNKTLKISTPLIHIPNLH